MKILVLVQSTEKEVYADLLKTQMETWDSIKHPDIDVVYYKASSKWDTLEDNILYIKNIDHISKVFSTFMKSIRFFKNKEWDYVVKTDNSVYLIKDKLYELIQSKPKTMYYGGVVTSVLAHRSDGFKMPIKFMWGECIILSRDVAMYLVNTFNKAPLKGNMSEDIVIGQLLENYCLWDEIKIHASTPADIDDPTGVIYRVRLSEVYKAEYCPIFGIPDNMSDVIKSDIKVMKKIHNIITNGKTDNRERIPQEAQDQA